MVSADDTQHSDHDAVRDFKLRTAQLSEGRVQAASFQPRPDDVMITTPPKSGTTWVCQIVQTLRSRGDLSFEEINMIIPFIEMAACYDYDLESDQGYSPRVYKSHFWYNDCPKGAKTIVVVREPLDVGPSFYYFLADWVFSSEAISMETFLKQVWMSGGAPSDCRQDASTWHWISSWFPHRHDPNVLWLHFEDLAADLPGCVSLIAKFLGLGADDSELQQLAVHQSNLETMKQNGTKYDEHVLKERLNERVGVPKDAGSGNSKVREGKVGSNRQLLTPEMQDLIQQKWEEVVMPVTGYRTYAELRAGINKEFGRVFSH